ncbi:hypothetical protein [Sphingomonas sp. BE137]|uniref:hypothetical protein n=1 Tax=Sphingomonas sp. BE137 TaxID=2817844 RepID=UPI001AE92A62|nr:hypothetical protein [Sphingomonas sp. BE137]MDR6850362.1 hypothetical protein [Sphingomonas sp. BE137]
MHDLESLSLAVRGARARLIVEDAAKHATTPGALALAREVALLRETVGPTLKAARDTLAASHVVLTIEEDWSSDNLVKTASYSITCQAGDGWPGNAAHARSLRVIITSRDGALSVASKPRADRNVVGDPVDCSDRDPVDAALAFVVRDFLARAEAGPKMQGMTLRQLGE